MGFSEVPEEPSQAAAVAQEAVMERRGTAREWILTGPVVLMEEAQAEMMVKDQTQGAAQ
jgi:hypothetical protein